MLFSTRNPPAIQRIPWPTRDDSEEEETLQQKTLARYDTWILNDQELPWLVEPDGEYTSFPCLLVSEVTAICSCQ
jgi:RAB6A-GEF complex partner protein 1